MRSLRHLMTAVVGLLMATLVAGPALAAMDDHAVSHAASAIDASEHHHHEEDGQIEVGHPETPSDQSDDDDGGHFHLPTGSGLAGLVDGGPAVPALLAAPAMHFAFVERPHSSLGAEPQIRPPRVR